MRIHREGKNILFNVFIILLSTHLLLAMYGMTVHQYYLLFTAIGILLYAWLIYFFRNPYRDIFIRKKYILAPADGSIVAIRKVYEDEYLQDHRIQISVFMSPFNVHVNRNPISGIVKFFKYHPGKYWVAWHPKSSTKNERTTIVIEHEQGAQILFRQIAGFLARRIKYYLKEGEIVQQGNEFGFIMLGSRVVIFLQLETKVKVVQGQKVKGGISVLAEW